MTVTENERQTMCSLAAKPFRIPYVQGESSAKLYADSLQKHSLLSPLLDACMRLLNEVASSILNLFHCDLLSSGPVKQAPLPRQNVPVEDKIRSDDRLAARVSSAPPESNVSKTSKVTWKWPVVFSPPAKHQK